MAESVRVVARFVDGRMLKGTTQDFLPDRPKFHVIPQDQDTPVQVSCSDLKAVFFVKTLEGNPRHKDREGFLESPSPNVQGRKIAVLFRDGELMCGYTLTYHAGRIGFFMLPSDPSDNNIRAYVMAGAAAEIKVGPAAEALAAKVLGQRKR